MKPTFEFAARRFLMGAACSSSSVLSSLVAAGVAERDFSDSLWSWVSSWPSSPNERAPFLTVLRFFLEGLNVGSLHLFS